jgi:hypothetical protein
MVDINIFVDIYSILDIDHYSAEMVDDVDNAVKVNHQRRLFNNAVGFKMPFLMPISNPGVIVLGDGSKIK